MELREVRYNLQEFVVSLHPMELRNQTLTTSSLWVTCTLSWWTMFRPLTHSLDFFLLSNHFAFRFALVTYHASTFQLTLRDSLNSYPGTSWPSLVFTPACCRHPFLDHQTEMLNFLKAKFPTFFNLEPRDDFISLCIPAYF